VFPQKIGGGSKEAIGRVSDENVLKLFKTWVWLQLQRNLKGLYHSGTVFIPVRGCYQIGNWNGGVRRGWRGGGEESLCAWEWGGGGAWFMSRVFDEISFRENFARLATKRFLCFASFAVSRNSRDYERNEFCKT
jgi:hypothetical protein